MNFFNIHIFIMFQPIFQMKCWLTWVVVTCCLPYNSTEIVSIIENPKQVTRVLGICLKKKCYKSILQSFTIFLEVNEFLSTHSTRIVRFANYFIKIHVGG